MEIKENSLNVAENPEFLEKSEVKKDPKVSTSVVYERKIDKLGRSLATGKRKRSIVRVYLSEGKGSFVINDREAVKFFPRATHQSVIRSPFECVGRDISKYTIVAKVCGGGCTGQAEGLRLALSKALFAFDPSCRPALKTAGFLTRDSRVVERKKYGLKKARKRFQFSKR